MENHFFFGVYVGILLSGFLVALLMQWRAWRMVEAEG